MADNNTVEKKFFLDWSGLQALWSKINRTFANKAEVEDSLSTITSNVATLTGNLQALDTNVNLRIDGVEDTIDTFMPREFPTYTDATKGAKVLAPGTVVNVKTASQLLGDDGKPVVDANGESPVYSAGLYVVVDPSTGAIEKLSTASGTGTGGNIEEVASFVEQLDKDVIKSASFVDETNQPLDSVDKVGNALIFKMDNEFVVGSQSVKALTHRAIAAMYGTLTEQMSKIPKFDIKVVDNFQSLPTGDDISRSTIYLVKNDDPTSNNIYAEYIYVEKDGQPADWEKLGEQSLVIEDFAKKTDVERMISVAMQNVVEQEDLTAALSTQKGEILTEVADKYITKIDVEKFIDQDELDATLDYYYTKEEADAKFLTQTIADTLYVKNADIEDFMTEPEIIASIQEGNIGNTIRITEEQIESLTI